MGDMGFYEKYIELLGNVLKGIPDKATSYKIEYLKSIIYNNRVYKFIPLNESARIKLNTFKQEKIWFSFYKELNDDTEFEIIYNAKSIAQSAGVDVNYVNYFVNLLIQVYDIYSLTYDYQDYMWEKYAANGNGICIVYEVRDYDFLFPVEYIDKLEIEFNKMLVNVIKRSTLELAIIPWVIKNPFNRKANLDSTLEKEVRIFYEPFSNSELNYGKLQCNVKTRAGYKGIAKPFKDFGLSIEKVIIGNECECEIKEELITYLDEMNIKYEFLL